MRECIHGLDEVLCDVCSPKPVVEAPVAPRVTARKAPGSSVKASRSGTRQAPIPPKPPLNLAEHRIFHITHLSNLESIVAAGKLLADASGAAPETDISTAETRERRRAAEIDGNTVAQFVPFFASPNSVLWQGIRSGAAVPRLDPAVRSTKAAEFVVLVSTMALAGLNNVIVADGDAADAGTDFSLHPEEAERALRLMLTPVVDEDGEHENERLRAAELLVWESFPLESITLVGVANSKARDEVKRILDTVPHSPKVSVYPPWFARP